MKSQLSLLTLLALLLTAGSAFASECDTLKTKTDTPKVAAKKSWFDKNVTIGQSMATSDEQALPAQLTVTLPEDKPGSYLINIGTAIKFRPPFWKKIMITKVTAEFHRNTLTDSVQENWQFGLKTTIDLSAKQADTALHIYLIADPQYTVDRVALTNSLASNFLITLGKDGGKFHWNANNFGPNKHGAFIPAVLFGAQVQEVFAENTTAPSGFKFRPLAIANLSYVFFKPKSIIDPLIRIQTTYAQRISVVNRTADGEYWSHLFRAGIDYFFLLKPVKLSMGASFVNGSDQFAGLKQQQYFLLSLNLFVGGK
jgi:hypothetical protein